MFPKRFVILGASGDLTGRYLLPALAKLKENDRLPGPLEVVGIARDAWNTDEFRARATERLERHAGPVAASAREAVVASLTYHQADVTEPDSLVAAIGRDATPTVFYLALPPALAHSTLEALARLPPPPGSRVVMEKPFGTDLESARGLNELVHRHFPEQMVFRMDHFLGHETVMNVLGLRFANRIFEPVWNRMHIDRVEIVWDETIALEGRAGYYDGAGALRDMLQNHLLQILCLIAMEPPLSFTERDLRDRKAELLRSVRKMSLEEAATSSVRARYTAGRIGDRDIPAYIEEEGVDAKRGTETFAEVQLTIENWRWAGVPFILRSGKALGKSRHEIAVHFQPVPHLRLGSDIRPAPNVLRFQLAPDRMSLLTNISQRRDDFQIEPIALEADLASDPLPVYARLLIDILGGDMTLSIRDDEAEECWRIVEPVLAAWNEGKAPMREYAAGSAGPEASAVRRG